MSLHDLGASLEQLGGTALEHVPAVQQFSTHLSETPVWFRFTVPPVGGDERTVIEFPSRHALAIRCWDAASMQLLGDASRAGEEGALAAAKSGFALRLPTGWLPAIPLRQTMSVTIDWWRRHLAAETVADVVRH